jgi:alpha-glucosidase
MVHEIPALGRLPVFARAGSIIPREPLTQSTAQIPDGPLELAVYPGPDCHGFLYDDDGHSRARERGDVLRQSVRCEQTGSGLKVIFEARQGTHAPWWKSLEVTVHGWNGPAPLARLDGVAVASRLDSAAQALHVTLPDQAGPAVLTLQ